MEQDKYRLLVKAKQGQFLVASSNTVNDLIEQLEAWLKGNGRFVMDEELVSIEFMEVDKNGSLVESKIEPVTKRSQLTGAADKLGAR